MNKPKCYKYGLWVVLVLSVCFFSSLVYGEKVIDLKPSDSAAALTNSAATASSSDSSPDEIQILKGDLESVKVSGLTRISLNDPGVADIISADDKEILLMGKGTGQTPMFIWDSRGKRTIMIRVYNQNLDLVEDRLKRLFKASDITGVNVDMDDKEGKVIISGEVFKDQKDDFDKILEPESESVINLVKAEDVQDLVQVDLQFVELNTTLLKNLGIDWTAGSGSSLTLAYPETIPTFDGSPGDWFKIGDFQRASKLLATVNTLVEQGKGRVLSKPKLVVVSGQEASFLVGGQIPFRTTTTTGSSVQESIEFKSYGIGMNITPTIKKGKIDILMGIDISDVDPATSIGGSKDVAFVTRNANTRLLLDDRQTIILAGLIKHNESEKKKKVPILGDIPLVGLFFTNKSNPTANVDTELVISLTPTILAQSKPKSGREVTMTTSSAPVMAEAPAPATASEAETWETEENIVLTSSMPTPSIKNERPQANIPKNMEAYVKSIQDKISKAIVYPQEAKDYGWEGTVRLGLLILSDGTLAFASVKESSGHEIFDEYAVNTAKQIAPYSSFPADSQLQELNVTIPIVYSLESN